MSQLSRGEILDRLAGGESFRAINFVRADLSALDLVRIDLSEANLRMADLNRADLDIAWNESNTNPAVAKLLELMPDGAARR